MWGARERPVASLLLLARRGYTTNLHRRRKEFLSKTYPRASTEEPNRLPRKGRRGGWMHDPSRGVAKLDGSNSAQRAWWDEHAGEVDRAFIERLQASKDRGPELQKVLDEHLEELSALKVAMPEADELRNRHIRRLASEVKQNPLHEALAPGPPLSSPPAPPQPEFVDESKLERGRLQRRGRFMGRPRSMREAPEEEEAEDDFRGEGLEEFAAPPPGPGASRHAERWEAQEEGDEVGGGSAPSRAGRGRRSTRRRQEEEELDESQDFEGVESPAWEVPQEGPVEPFEPLRTTSLGELWAAYGASFAEFNRCIVPSEFPARWEDGAITGGTMGTYEHTRTAASLFDVSYKVGLRITGADREFAADQFLTCNLRAMRPGDVQFSCILDSKGLILDDAFVYLSSDAVEIWTSGCHTRQVADYLSLYLVHVRRSGADVAFEASPRSVGLALQGPRACEALASALTELGGEAVQLESIDREPIDVGVAALDAMPYMSCLSLRDAAGEPDDGADHSAALLRVGTTGEDGFEIFAPPGPLIARLAGALLKETPLVRPGGLHCLDILRMEAGLARVGTDITPGRISPIRASLIWMLDQAKMRNHLMFGWQQLFFQLAKGPKSRRVGLVLSGPGHAGCRLLSNPHRQPMGVITSSSWSPALKSRVAMAFVRPEYAKSNKHVLVSVPYNLPTHKMRVKAIKHWTKSGTLRSAYRRLVPAVIAPLPFVPHRYPEPARQRKAAARLRTFAPDAARQAAQQAQGEASPPPRRGAAEPPGGRVRRDEAGRDPTESDLRAT